jgi:hypothetical protein
VNRRELAQRLRDANVDEDSFDLADQRKEEAYCLAETPEGWVVFYHERGLRRGERVFPSEDQACAYMLDLLLADPTTRRRSQ